MDIWKILGIYVVISGFISFYAVISAPIMDKSGSRITGESKLQQWKSKLWKKLKK
jgi:hypothetical protein|tara:strand:+ start:44 stop:208 length:165 start_codon:yes stop_codon:yes gene_type:complete